MGFYPEFKNMATHNQLRIMGYLVTDPLIMNNGETGAEKAIFTVRTARRELDSYYESKFEEVVVFYDGEELMPKIKKLVKFDFIDIKGVCNILSRNKRSTCPNCGAQNVKTNGTSCFVYPITLMKLNSLHAAYEHDKDIPDRILAKYDEISNQALIIGTVVNDPEIYTRSSKLVADVRVCRYRLGVDRKYFIKTQDDITSDYPWVYSYGQQAEDDARYLHKGSVIMVDGFLRNRRSPSTMICSNCGREYQYKDMEGEFIPYSIEYLQNFFTEEEAKENEALEKEMKAANARREIFGS